MRRETIVGASNTDEQESPGELEDLFDAPDGDSGGGDPFGSWGIGPSTSTATVPPAGRAVPPTRPVQPHGSATPSQSTLVAAVDDSGSRNGQSGFRVSQDIADRLKQYRQDHDLTVTEVVIEALDYIADDIPAVMSRAKMPAKVTPTRSRFAARGRQGPLKGTGPVQRWWQPTVGDKQVVVEMATEAGVRDTPGILIAVALNEFLPGGAMHIAGQLRRQLQEDTSYQVPAEANLARTYGVPREVARQALTQLEVDGFTGSS